MKKLCGILVIASILTVLIAACGGATTSLSTAPAHEATSTLKVQPGTVHMNNTRFVPDTITMKKGERLTLIDDVAVVHFIANGRWKSDGNAKYAREAGAPKVGVQFNGNDSHNVGPFTVAGTFHLYCTVHQGMNLTIVVQ